MTIRHIRRLNPDELTALFEKLEAANSKYETSARDGAVLALEAVTAFIAAHSPGNEHLGRPIEKVLSRMRGIDPQRISPGDVWPSEGGESGGVKRRADEQQLRGTVAYALEFLQDELNEPLAQAAETIAALLDRAKVPFGKSATDKKAAIKKWFYACRAGTDKASTYYQKFREDAPIPACGDPFKRGVALMIWFDGKLRQLGHAPPGVEWLPSARDFIE